MNKSEIFSHYSEVIDELLDSSLWMQAWFQRPSWLDDHICGEDFDELPSNISINDGATRGCIVDDDYDYVVKFDIEEDNEGSACEREEKIYRMAKACEMSQYLNEIVYIGTYTRSFYFYNADEIFQCCHVDYSYYDEDNFCRELEKHEDELELRQITLSIPLYACKRAYGYDCGPINNDLISRAQKIYSPLREKNLAVATAFIRDYGEEEYQLFSDFAIENDINDLHLGNIGMVDGKLIFIDYAGYYNGEESYC